MFKDQSIYLLIFNINKIIALLTKYSSRSLQEISVDLKLTCNCVSRKLEAKIEF